MTRTTRPPRTTRAPRKPASQSMRVMMMDAIHYDDLGLPFIQGGVPGQGSQAAPVLG